jgi:hypothetical protein
MRFFRSNSCASRKSLVVSRKSHSFFVCLAMIAFLLFTGCKSEYRGLEPGASDVNCIPAFSPQFSNTLYSAVIDVTTHHFSGILFFKQMPDSSTRIVFTNEMGVKFFDFGFAKDGVFTKYYIMPKLDKKVVVKALRNDMRLVLLRPDLAKARALKDDTYSYIAVPSRKGNDYYITDNNCSKLVRIEKSSKRKPVVVVVMQDYKNGVPDSINIQHQNFKFNISLKRVEK